MEYDDDEAEYEENGDVDRVPSGGTGRVRGNVGGESREGVRKKR